MPKRRVCVAHVLIKGLSMCVAHRWLCVDSERPFVRSRDGDKMAPAVEKKIAELEMGLLHLQQNIDIPDISLTIHPIVAQVSGCQTFLMFWYPYSEVVS